MASLSQHKPLFLQSLLTVCSLTQMKSDVIVYSRKDKITVKSFMNHLIFLLLCPPPNPRSSGMSTKRASCYHCRASWSHSLPYCCHTAEGKRHRDLQREREALQSVSQVRLLSPYMSLGWFIGRIGHLWWWRRRCGTIYFSTLETHSF